MVRLLERYYFEERIAFGKPISLHEFFYPLMQGYDSVVLESDIELGGTDQHFNILMGRHFQEKFGKEKQIALLMPLLEGLEFKGLSMGLLMGLVLAVLRKSKNTGN